MFKLTEEDMDQFIQAVHEWNEGWTWCYESFSRTQTRPFPEYDGRFKYILDLSETYSDVIFARMWLTENGHDFEAWWDAGDGHYVIMSDYAPAHWIESLEKCKSWNEAKRESQ